MILRAENIVKKYRKRTVVNGVSFDVHQGEIVGLLGPNGAGKTTSFYMIVGLIQPFSGKIFLNDEEITHLPVYKKGPAGDWLSGARSQCFQEAEHRRQPPCGFGNDRLFQGLSAGKLESLLLEFGLQHIRKSKGYQLSGGERRRTEIARALAIDPKFILLDEPFAGVDPIAVEDIQHIVSQLKEKNIGVLITDHNVHETLSITDRSYLLFEGSILKSGTAQDLANDEVVRKVYLGQNFELR